ncbi:WAT1-related protein At3g18200-like [Magnolia sinica]|uniref:WAT1-related protein At3g18200-like n=1 Tax=Magnolia sinica TaxID=86752 RepID=UPI00265A8541|nr:WAT1-related protein At3g18200-like [Magnolia sinica]
MACSTRNAKKIAPYAYMVLAQIIAASYSILSKIVFTQGTSTVVFIIYQFIAAVVFMGPLAYFIERKTRPPLTLSILCWMFLLALLGATLFQNLFSASLNYISSTTQSAILNLFPAFTYLLSVASRQEVPELNRVRGVGKLSGTILSVAGALTMILWQSSVAQSAITGPGNWVVGFVLAIMGILSLSTWLVLQEPATRRYPAELSMTTMMYFFGTLQTCVLAAFVSREASEWKLKWDLELLNIFFGGVLNSGIGIFIFSWCARVKGPLFVAVFAPLTLLLTALADMLFLGETMNVGSIVGSLMIVGGLYLFLWAKSKEESNDPKHEEDAITSPLLLT